MKSVHKLCRINCNNLIIVIRPDTAIAYLRSVSYVSTNIFPRTCLNIKKHNLFTKDVQLCVSIFYYMF